MRTDSSPRQAFPIVYSFDAGSLAWLLREDARMFNGIRATVTRAWDSGCAQISRSGVFRVRRDGAVFFESGRDSRLVSTPGGIFTGAVLALFVSIPGTQDQSFWRKGLTVGDEDFEDDEW